MGWMAPKLKHRIQIQVPVQTPNDFGAFVTTYVSLTTIWSAVRDRSNFVRYAENIRGVNTSETELSDTTFIVRWVAVKNLGQGFTDGFDTGFDIRGDLNPIKSDQRVFLQVGNNSEHGRLYKIIGARRDDNRKEWLEIDAKLIEEQGTGFAD